jgi:co-chaperonin GroES (HSP10)
MDLLTTVIRSILLNNMIPENFRLLGHHFIGNVISPLKKEERGLIIPDSDPRKSRMKPDAFPIRIDEVGPRCTLVKEGDIVVIERWMWKQYNIDNERMIAHEADLLILNDSVPAPGVIVVKIIEDIPKTGLALPQSYKPKNPGYIHGLVTHSNYKDCQVGWEIWVEKIDHNQFLLGKDKLIFRIDEEIASVLAYRSPQQEKQPIKLEVIAPEVLQNKESMSFQLA